MRSTPFKRSISFLIFAFAWSWTCWILGLNVLQSQSNSGIIAFIPYFFAGVYGPTISAIVMTSYFEGGRGVKELLLKLFRWRFPVKNYVIAFFLPLIFVGVALLILHWYVGTSYNFTLAYASMIPVVLYKGLFAGPLGEELGWRGFLLTELQQYWAPLKSATVIGVIWFLWHVPLFYAPFGTLVSGLESEINMLHVLMYLAMLIALSWIITWLVNASRGSVLIAVLFHLFVNAGLLLLIFPGPDQKMIHLVSGFAIIAIAIGIGYKTKLKKEGVD